MARTPLPPEILRSLPLSEELEGEAKKERDIITSNRVKLTEYIHDVTLLFPYMKEKGVFTIDDCDIVRAEPTGTLKVDKFVDIFLTKGPKAIGVFHEALDAHYPAVFDYLAWLFTHAGVQLSQSRQLRDRDKDSQTSSLKSNLNGLVSRGLSVKRYGSRTVRKSLDILSRQCEYVQRERDELQKSLISREREISSLLSSRDQFQSNLLAVTQKYQELLLELGHWRDLLSNQSEGGYKRMQELLSERESIQAEYDQLEGEFMLVSSELNAARDRISRLLNHLERSEAVVAITQEDKEKLKDKLEVYQGEIQRLHRKIERLASRDNQSEASGSIGVGEGDAQSLGDKCLEKLQSELDKALDNNKELKERLQVAHIERREALEEKDDQLRKCHAEWEKRKKAEQNLRNLRQKQHPPDTHSQLSYTSASAISPDELTNVRPEDFTIVMPAPSSSDPGMDLGLGVVVRTVAENGLASNNGVKPGDELYQVNHINLAVDKEPLEFARRLLLSASQTVTLSIKRQVPSSVMGLHPSLSFPALSLTTTPTSPCLGNPLEQQILMQHRCSAGMLPIAEHLSLSLSRSQVSSTTSTSTSAKSHDDQTSGEDRGGNSEDSGTEHLPLKSRDGEYRRSGMYPGNRISAVSNQSDGSGLISSPTASIGHDRHRDSIMPDTITEIGGGTTILGRTLPQKYEPPTSILGHGEGGEGGESVEGGPLSQECEDELCPLQPPTPPRWRKCSQDSDNEFQRLHRGGNKGIYRNRREKERKISRSMDDMTEVGHNDMLVFSPKIDRKELQVNRVLLPRGQLGRGLKLVGGRGYGVFIHSHRHTSRGLQTGDQITKIGNKSVDNLTYAEVVDMLHSYTHTGEQQCILSLRHNMDAYSRLPSTSARDNFYVRTKFPHQKKSVRGELTFEKGHIFHVVDTLPLGHGGMWRAERVGSKGEIGEMGLVPISLSPTEMMETTSMSLPRFLQSFSPKEKRRNGAHTLEEQKVQKTPAVNAFLLYEPIRKVKVMEPRPVVLLGALEVDIRRYLVENGSNEDIKFSYCKREPADTLQHKNCDVIESLTTSDGIVMKSTVQHAQHVARKGYHCVLCLEPEQLIKSSVAQLCPIALLLDVKNSKTVKQIQASCNLPPERHGNPLVHLDRIKAMQKYLPCFTGEVSLPSTMKEVIQVVREMVARQQKSVMWEVEEH